MQKTMKHIGFLLASLTLLVGVPFLFTSTFASLASGQGIDAVSGASVILDAPSGVFVILINEDKHPDAAKLADWTTFFSGGEITYIFEDISCAVPRGDTLAKELADSFRSRLPENQMTVTTEEPALLFSRADNGCFDILIMSAEYESAYHAESARKPGVRVIEYTSGGVS